MNREEELIHIVANLKKKIRMLEGHIRKITMICQENSSKFSLTPREIEILRLFCNGMSKKDIMELLEITENTIKSHLGHIYKKFGVSSLNQAIAFSIKNGIVVIVKEEKK